MPTRVFIHGLESSGRGEKGAFFKKHFPDMIVEDYVGSFSERMEKLEKDLEGKEDLILVGSSYGGLMAAAYACRNVGKIGKLILLAPALNHLPPEACSIVMPFPVVLYHGSEDTVVPPAPVCKRARGLFTNLTYHLVEDDHSLHRSFYHLPWAELLDEEVQVKINKA